MKNLRDAKCCKFCSHCLHKVQGWPINAPALYCNVTQSYTGDIILHSSPWRFNEAVDPVGADHRVASNQVCDLFEKFDK